MIYCRWIKRAIGFLVALISLLLLSPIFLMVAFAVRLDSKGPIFFRQTRIGRNRKPFTIYKFRSMKIGTPDVPTCQLENTAVITRVGGFLRKTSLDELPQLWNILMGHMSIIGPRPVIPGEFDGTSYLLEDREAVGANAVRPGLTGLAQINGRDNVSNREKARMDGEYVKNMSFGLDLKIFLKTIAKVLLREGITEGKQSKTPSNN